MAYPNSGARNQYLKTQVETATKEQLVVMLFDGIIRFTEQARKAIEEKQIEASHNALMRAQAIIMELICTVDKEKGGKIASNLMGLHAYAFNCLIVCNMKKDISKIDEVQKIYRELREGWVGAMESLGIAGTAAGTAAGAAVPAAAPAPAAKAPAAIPKAPPAAALMPKSPLPAAPKAAPATPAAIPAKPAVGPGSSGIMASAKPAAAAPAAPAMATGYGLGRTAMMPGVARPAAAAPKAPVSPAAAQAAVPAKPVATSPLNSKQAAMLNAYQAASGGSRSIA